MQIAITGGSGRVGSAVARLALAQGHNVVNIDRAPPSTETDVPDVPFVQVDLTDYAAFEQALRGCDALVHLAAIPSPYNLTDYEVHNNNVVTSYNALSAATRLGITRICQASSINAIGGVYSRWPTYDYFPVDEDHPSYAEDAYSLSKWICEQQADAFARRYDGLVIASMRFHWVTPQRPLWRQDELKHPDSAAKHMWGYTLAQAAARACLLSLTADFRGHEAFYIVAPDTIVDAPSRELARQYFPDVPLQRDLPDRAGFFDCRKAERLLGWTHFES